MAGFFVKPLLVAGHDSLWYWTRARAFDQKNQKWNAYFYYTTAAYLATPADFLTSTNLEKLNQETANSRPDGLPGAQPMVVTADGKTLFHQRTAYRWLAGRAGPGDPLCRDGCGRPGRHSSPEPGGHEGYAAAHPELREGFHGLWVFAEAPPQRPFGNELAMSDIH